MISVQNRAACRVWLRALAGTVSLAAFSLVAAQPAAAQQGSSAAANPTAQQTQPAPPAQQAPPPPPPVPQLILGLNEKVQAAAAAARREEQERAQRIQRMLEEQRQKTRAMRQRRDRAQAETDRLDSEFFANQDKEADLQERLELQQGNLGELFGVTRQVAGDASTTLGGSLISTQIKTPEGKQERSEFLRQIAGSTSLPDSNELRQLWYEIFREIVETGKVVRYTAPVALRDASMEGKQLTEEQILALPIEEREVVRVGPFIAVTDNGEYLGYLPSRKVLTELDGQLGSSFRAIGRELMAASPTGGYTTAVVDPASGALLGLYIERPNWFERIEQGEVVGWVIVGVGILGVAVALVQAIYLVMTRAAVSRQLRNLNDPRPNNPLGRVLLAFRGDGRQEESAELAELRLSEAVLREIPRLERFQAFLRLAVAAGPLLGLIGTVIGMIITFKAITASGSSDPKLMAQGIGQAMIATVLGLGIAIPLLFINSGLAAMSRAITQILDEQSHAMLADRVGHSSTS